MLITVWLFRENLRQTSLPRLADLTSPIPSQPAIGFSPLAHSGE